MKRYSISVKSYCNPNFFKYWGRTDDPDGRAKEFDDEKGRYYKAVRITDSQTKQVVYQKEW